MRLFLPWSMARASHTPPPPSPPEPLPLPPETPVAVADTPVAESPAPLRSAPFDPATCLPPPADPPELVLEGWVQMPRELAVQMADSLARLEALEPQRQALAQRERMRLVRRQARPSGSRRSRQ